MEMLKYLKKDRKAGLLAVFCVMFETMFELVIPLIMADIIDVGVVLGDRDIILQKGLLMLACAVASLILGILYARYSAQFANGVAYHLREDIFKKIQSFSFENIDQFSSSSLMTRLTSDVAVIQNSLATGLRPLVRAPVMLLTALTLSFLMNPTLAIVFLVAAPCLGIILFMIIKRVRPLFKRMQSTVDQVNRIVQENLRAIRVVKAFVREDFEIDKFEEVNQSFRSVSEEAFRIATLNAPALQAIMYTTIIAILWFGGNLIMIGSMKVGQLTGFLSYVLQVLNALMMISNVFMLLTRAITSHVRIQQVLTTEGSLDQTQVESQLQVQDGSIVFDHVSFKYASKAKENVLEDVSFAISSGDFVGIIGTTGSSKSTIAQLMVRLYDASEGVIYISGEPIKHYDTQHLRDEISIVLQKNMLFSGTVIENIRWGNEDATQDQVEAVCKIAQADGFIREKKGGYNSIVEQGGDNFSGGQKQRLCIARALLKEPKILIFDDSTSALDQRTEASIWSEMRKAYPDSTKVVIAQKISSVKDADLIIIMDDGQIHAAGQHEALLKTSEIYRDIYQSQQEGVL